MNSFGFKFQAQLLLISAICAACCFDLAAQSVAQLQRQAEKSLKRGLFADAAAQLERAGRIKNSDPLLLYRAAEAYNEVRDYLNASNCYQVSKDDQRFPLAALFFARALKQQGRYTEAREAFQKTGEGYRGDHKEVIIQVIANEVTGCDLAIRLLEEYDSSAANASIAWLPPPVASGENTFAPMPFSDTLLYFSQTSSQGAILMRSTRRNGVWRKPEAAAGLPQAASKDFLCGAFSAKGERYYFARSEHPPLASRGSSVAASGSTLYVLRRDATGEWGEPERLRGYINLEESSNTQPFVCDFGTEEWLFFASNRPGGMGGMDLYVCKRPLAADDLDFSFPLNLGAKVNTGADETTPYYDVFSKTLWFSSMGHPGLGGLDIQHASGEGSNWTNPENAGFSINSPADDIYFILKKDGSGAFFSSNRLVPKEKASTTADNLFEAFFPTRN